MVNPTGYTALDLVGYTDRGTYAAATNYVKNDLAHHNGIIWRCLIDDTIGITPVEGVNWTVFINAGSAAAEEIIAPIETSPAAAAHTSGTQLIYNDTLYDVIANISIGDSLTVGTNIQAAPKISSQIQTLTNNKADTVSVISDVYEVTTPAFSSLPQTFTAQGITANHKLVVDGYAMLSNPSAQGSDWTITPGTNTITISGTFSGSMATTVTMTLGVKRAITATA